MRKRELKNVEWGLIIVAVLLTIIGLVALYSATQENSHDDFKKQLVWFGISIVMMIITMLTSYETLIRISPVFYVIFILLLIGVLFTPPINGATSWFDIGAFSFQPSEFAKVVVILFLAYIISRIQSKYKEDINKPTRLLIIFIALAVPLVLIVRQPDYGTAMAFIISLAVILFTSGLDKKYIFGAIIIIGVSVPLLYNFVLPQHAKQRIDIYLNPESDPRGAGYNIIQSKIAVGSGQLLGMGLLKGNQTQLGYLSPKTTDFIFSAIGEEMGFVITGTIIVLYVFVVTKAIYIAKTAKDLEGRLIASGIAGIFLFHMTENIGMVMGLLPITGVPLLFISYGGSSLITSYILIGILLNISSKRQKTIFVKWFLQAYKIIVN